MMKRESLFKKQTTLSSFILSVSITFFLLLIRASLAMLSTQDSTQEFTLPQFEETSLWKRKLLREIRLWFNVNDAKIEDEHTDQTNIFSL